MLALPAAARAWPGADFAAVLKAEIERLAPGTLPLDGGTAHGGRADDAGRVATVLSSSEDAEAIHADVGIFFAEILAGCSCGDEPQAMNAYCEVRVRIDKTTAAATFALLPP